MNRNNRTRGGNFIGGYLQPNLRYGIDEIYSAPPASSYDDYISGAFCRVVPRSSYQTYGHYNQEYPHRAPQGRPEYNLPAAAQKLPSQYPYRRINTIAEEERRRILSIRRQEEEDRMRERKLQEEHERTLRIRAGQNSEHATQRPASGQARPASGRARPRPGRLPLEAQIAQEIALSQLDTSADGWDEFLEEIQRPPPDQQRERAIFTSNETSRALLSGTQIARSHDDQNAEKRKELYDRNIASVQEMARHKSEEPCSVCFDDEPETMLIMVCCKQYFCFACISAWWKEKKTCPACRIEDPVFVEVAGK